MIARTLLRFGMVLTMVWSLAVAGCGSGSGSPSPTGVSKVFLGANWCSTCLNEQGEFIHGVQAFADPKLLVTSAIRLDTAGKTITLPLFKGKSATGGDIWYVITEASDRAVAEKLGVNWAPKLVNALFTAAVQPVTVADGAVVFPGTADFSQERLIVPGVTGFPPLTAIPGSLSDARYTPLITAGDGVVVNAPHVANSTGVHDRVVNIDVTGQEVTVAMTNGLYHGKRIQYVSFDASDSAGAAIERATFAPNLNAAPGIGTNDPLTSARAAIVPIVNGATGVDNPNRQGLQSALLGEGDPLNVTEIHPRNRGEIPIYSPLWDVHPAVWTDAAIAAGQRRLLDHHEDIARAVEEGLIISAGTGPANPVLGGLRAADFVVNCPVMVLFD